MSVFTSIDMPQLAAFLKAYPVGPPVAFTGIEAGITNSNYFIDTGSVEALSGDKETVRFVLTIVEHESFEDVEWFMQLLAYLHSNRIPCAQPIRSIDDHYTRQLAGKPATVVRCLRGAEKETVTADDCHAIGQVLARFHNTCQHYPSQRRDSRGAEWREETARRVRSALEPQEKLLLDKHMSADYTDRLASLPQSVIHADLFRDNVLFAGDEISGIIDFYYACSGCTLYDLAITFNDWCRDQSCEIDLLRARSLLSGYESVRPLQSAERDSWATAVDCAALRFWLSRLIDLHYPPEALMTYTKDPTPFRKILSRPSPQYVDLTP